MTKRPRKPMPAVAVAALTLIAAGLWITAFAGPLRAAALDVEFRNWIAAFRPEALAFGISADTYDREMATARFNARAPDLVLPGQSGRPETSVKGQAEFTRPPQAYLNAKQLAGLAATGRDLAGRHKPTLSEIEQRIGVPAPVVLAIWGRETAFGGHKLKDNAIDALATQAFLGRRKDMFRNELLHALKMIEDGHASRQQLRASWAGAVGLTQFMPSEFYSTAYDLDGDGRRDLWAVPDALASAANQLKQKGWLGDRPWGVEVRLSDRVDCAMAGPQNTRPIRDWAAAGVRRVDGRAFTAAEQAWPAYLLVPGGTYGPVFLVTENYVVFRRYNMSDLYALFVGDLANRIAGEGTFRTPWADLVQIRADELAEIQSGLKSAGYAISIVDGKLGSNTRSQIGLYQRDRGLTTDCWPTRALLDDVRANATKKPAR